MGKALEGYLTQYLECPDAWAAADGVLTSQPSGEGRLGWAFCCERLPPTRSQRDPTTAPRAQPPIKEGLRVRPFFFAFVLSSA